MIIPVLYFLIGIIIFAIQRSIPVSLPYILILTASSILMLLTTTRLQKHRALIWIPLGFFWVSCYVYHLQLFTLNTEQEGMTLTVTGTIMTIPEINTQDTSFQFALDTLQKHPTHAHIHLSWRNAPHALSVGDHYQLTVRLKKIYGTRNPGSFDYEAWAWQEGLRANGYVVDKMPYKELTTTHTHGLTQIRDALNRRLDSVLPHTPTAPWIRALIIGLRTDIPSSDWEILRTTGTNHLMAIAGLHIGFMAITAAWIVARLWRFSNRLCLLLPAKLAGLIAALVMALLYSALAGFSIPSQRASFMLTILLIIMLSRRTLLPWQAWSMALFLVLILNPLSVLSDSFWLSFGSVALIIYGVSGRLQPQGLWWKWGRIQWVIALGLIPLSIAIFYQCSLIAFLANLVSIPIVACLIVPLSLFSSAMLLISPSLSRMLFQLDDHLMQLLWKVLACFAHSPHAVWYQHFPDLTMAVFATLGVVLLLLPIGCPGRWYGFLFVLPTLLYQTPVPLLGQAKLTLLDIGQGLSAVVQTQHHTLVFDTGAKFGAKSDMGDSILVPFLHYHHQKSVDMLVISHGDNDHIGGAASLIREIPVISIRSSVPSRIKGAEMCLRGQHWTWDGVEFQFLHPTAHMAGLDNNSSCVLRVSVGQSSVLLTGDIEKAAEFDLVASLSTSLQSTILIAPHHGSKTSADLSFIKWVNPRWVLFPVGYRNRYHFPHTNVVQRYDDLHIRHLATDVTGAIEYVLSSETIVGPSAYRCDHLHFWNNLCIQSPPT